MLQALPQSQLLQQFQLRRPMWESLAQRLASRLSMILTNRGIVYDHINSRVKSQASFLEKVVRKGYRDPLAECEDICGVRVVLIFSDDVDIVRETLEQELDVLRVEDKRPLKGGNDFGYSSLHLIVGGDEPGEVAEVQVRSIMQHSWAQLEHLLHYKPVAGATGGTRREFQRLAALLELADESFVRIRNEGKDPGPPSPRTRNRWVEESPADFQSHPACSDGLVVWSQAGRSVRVRPLRPAGQPAYCLSAPHHRESRCQSNGRQVAVYRENCGAVLYDLQNGRGDGELVVPNCSPTSMDANWLACEHVKGGVGLLNLRDRHWQVVSPTGFRARVSAGWVAWEDLTPAGEVVYYRKIQADTAVAIEGATQPSLRQGLLAWVETRSVPCCRVLDLVTGDFRAHIDGALWPYLYDFRLAFLRRQDHDYALIVKDLVAQRDLTVDAGTPFPTHAFPCLGPDSLVWEGNHSEGSANLRRRSLKPSSWRQILAHSNGIFNGLSLQSRLLRIASNPRKNSKDDVLQVFLEGYEGLLKIVLQTVRRLDADTYRWLSTRLRGSVVSRLKSQVENSRAGLDEDWNERAGQLAELLWLARARD